MGVVAREARGVENDSRQHITDEREASGIERCGHVEGIEGLRNVGVEVAVSWEGDAGKTGHSRGEGDEDVARHVRRRENNHRAENGKRK